MKILQLGKAYPPVNLGGVEITIKLLTEGLNKYEYVICDALGANETNSYSVDVLDNKYKVIRAKCLGKYFSTLISFQLIKILKNINRDYDIIHLHAPDPMAGLAVFLTRPKAKIFLHWHSDILKQKFFFFFYKFIQTWLLKRADVIIATSPKYASYSPYLRKYEDKTEVVPIGIPSNYTILPDAEITLVKAAFPGKKIVFSLGRLAYYKGFEYLILAAKKLPSDYVILIGGGGPLADSLRQLISNNNLSDQVILLGYLTDQEKERYMQACDMFCLSSIFRTEAFGIVQLEAMQRGKPLISTKIEGSGVDWVNKDGVTGITVDVCDAEQIANAIHLIGGDKVLRDKFSRNCGETFTSFFTQEAMVLKLMGIYNQIVKG